MMLYGFRIFVVASLLAVVGCKGSTAWIRDQPRENLKDIPTMQLLDALHALRQYSLRGYDREVFEELSERFQLTDAELEEMAVNQDRIKVGMRREVLLMKRGVPTLWHDHDLSKEKIEYREHYGCKDVFFLNDGVVTRIREIDDECC